ncbi:MAG: thermonuclease family protein [Methanobacteriaceae archaeon]|nr:thermonuclease family protein [Methanobacteriaceae archaeon]
MKTSSIIKAIYKNLLDNMHLKILLVTLSIFLVSVAGCVQEDINQYYSSLSYGNNSSNSLNNSTHTDPTSSPGEVTGKCYRVVDGDTIDVEGVGRVRFVGVNTPERGQPGYSEAKEFIKNKCLYQTVSLDVDDEKRQDKYGRTLAVIYVDNLNLNQQLLKDGYAEIMYIPPSEFNPYAW